MMVLKHGGMRLSDSAWLKDKAWADNYLPAIRAVVCGLAQKILTIEFASEQEDQEHAFDYLVTLSEGKIACRIRRPECDYRDFTIRAWRASGSKTELSKIKEGFGQWYLYAWAKDEKTFISWVFIDLDKLRTSGLLEKDYPIIPNPDKETGFISLKILDLLHNDCVVSMFGCCHFNHLCEALK